MEENVSIRLTLPKELVNQLPDDREELNTFVAEAIKNALRRRDDRRYEAGRGRVEQVVHTQIVLY